MKRHLLTSLALTALVLFAIGCSEQATEPDTGGLNLVDEFGGFTATSEQPAFGDGELQDEADQEVDYNDPMLASAPVDSLVNDPDAGLFHLRVVWGRLEYDSTVTTMTDWTGSLTISRGAEVVRRLIRFEPGQDELLPRTDRTLIEWKSITTVHNDGIAVDLLVPRPRPELDSILVTDSSGSVWVIDTLWPDPVTVTFETGPYSRTFTLAEIAALDTVVYLDDSNAVAFHGMQFFKYRCPRGFLTGEWGYNEEGNGVFRGMWTDQHGFITGWVRGHFGQDDNGRNVFFGKWISHSGRFEGFLRGSWRPAPNVGADPNAMHHAGGLFWGEIFSADRVRIGHLRGRYRNSDHFRGGFFQARWKLDCNDLRPDDPGTGDMNRDRNRDFNDNPFNDGFGE